MSFHNVRSANGRFAPKAKKSKNGKKKIVIESKKAVEKAVEKHILNVFVLDNSPSMTGKEAATVSGFNEILDSGRKDSVKTGVNSTELLAFFSGTYKRISAPVDKVYFDDSWSASNRFEVSGSKNVRGIKYAADGNSTALWDATAESFADAEHALKSLPAGTKVIVTIFTDGEENASRVWSKVSIAKAIKDVQDRGWVVNFVGAGTQKEVEAVATSVGIFASNTMSYANNSVGTKTAMRTFTKSKSLYSAAVADGLDSNIGFFGN